MRFLLWLLLSIVLVAGALAGRSTLRSAPLHDAVMPPGLLKRVAIAPGDEALTFARYEVDGAPQVLMVQSYENGRVTGVNLTRLFRPDRLDPIALHGRFGYDVLREAAVGIEPVTVPAEALLVPIETHAQHIGAGANYAAHAREVSLEDPPFLFPKLVQPTPFNSPVRLARAQRLDYEVELCLVTLQPLVPPGEERLPLGLLLCNDYTDRWAFVRGFRRDAPMGTTGFVQGKSREGFAPVGNLFVIPRDVDRFMKNLELSLYLNGRLRQRAPVTAMRWGPRRLLEEIALRAEWTFHGPEGGVSLVPGGELRAATLIFSGTPAGVVFRLHNLWNPWIYLSPGDEVVMHSDYLGIVHNRITP